MSTIWPFSERVTPAEGEWECSENEMRHPWEPQATVISTSQWHIHMAVEHSQTSRTSTSQWHIQPPLSLVSNCSHYCDQHDSRCSMGFGLHLNPQSLESSFCLVCGCPHCGSPIQTESDLNAYLTYQRNWFISCFEEATGNSSST